MLLCVCVSVFIDKRECDASSVRLEKERYIQEHRRCYASFILLKDLSFKLR